MILLRELSVGISKSDFLPVLHFFMFISIGIFVNNIFQMKRTEKLLSGYLISIPIGAHIGNYFWSGIEKIRIYEFSFGWILDNDTLNIARAALLNNQLPLELLTGSYTEKFIQSLDSFLIPMNSIVFFSQILSVLFLTNKRSLITVTVFFDIFHLSVFILSGIFFYKWIFLNILIIIYLRKSNCWGGVQKILAVSACLIGFGIHITKLGWHDSNTFYDRYLTKQSDGQELRFPPSMFNYYSLELAQQRMGSTPPLTTNTYGSINNKSITSDFVTAANDCMINGPDALYTTEWLSEFVRIQRELFTFLDKFNYPKSLFPHHIWSPTEYKHINYEAFADGKIEYEQIKYCFKHEGAVS